MGDTNGAAVQEQEDLMKATRKGTPEGDPAARLPEGTEDTALADLKGEEPDEEKALKWRFLAKGTALDNILKVFGGRAEAGDKQTSFVVGTGEKATELGDVARLLFARLAEAGVTLRDLVNLAKSKKPAGK